jgi:hypothetical protein
LYIPWHLEDMCDLAHGDVGVCVCVCLYVFDLMTE